MNRRTAENLMRRENLQLQCVAQRAQLAQARAAIESELRPLNRALAALHRLRISPTLLAGGAALALGLGSRRAAGFASRAWLVFSSVQRVWQLLQSLQASRASAAAGASRRSIAAGATDPQRGKQQEQAKQRLDRELDQELDGTFPASDPLPWSHKVD